VLLNRVGNKCKEDVSGFNNVLQSTLQNATDLTVTNPGVSDSTAKRKFAKAVASNDIAKQCRILFQ